MPEHANHPNISKVSSEYLSAIARDAGSEWKLDFYNRIIVPSLRVAIEMDCPSTNEQGFLDYNPFLQQFDYCKKIIENKDQSIERDTQFAALFYGLKKHNFPHTIQLRIQNPILENRLNQHYQNLLRVEILEYLQFQLNELKQNEKANLEELCKIQKWINQEKPKFNLKSGYWHTHFIDPIQTELLDISYALNGKIKFQFQNLFQVFMQIWSAPAKRTYFELLAHGLSLTIATLIPICNIFYLGISKLSKAATRPLQFLYQFSDRETQGLQWIAGFMILVLLANPAIHYALNFGVISCALITGVNFLQLGVNQLTARLFGLNASDEVIPELETSKAPLKYAINAFTSCLMPNFTSFTSVENCAEQAYQVILKYSELFAEKTRLSQIENPYRTEQHKEASRENFVQMITLYRQANELIEKYFYMNGFLTLDTFELVKELHLVEEYGTLIRRAEGQSLDSSNDAECAASRNETSFNLQTLIRRVMRIRAQEPNLMHNLSNQMSADELQQLVLEVNSISNPLHYLHHTNRTELPQSLQDLGQLEFNPEPSIDHSASLS